MACGAGRLPKPDNRYVAGLPFHVVEIRPRGGPIEAQLSQAVAQARASHLKPFVELTSAWCRGCHWLDRSLDDPSMAQAFGGTFVVRVDVDHWEGRLGGTRLDDHSGPLPAFVALGRSGMPVGDWIDPQAWGTDLPHIAAPVLADFFHWP